MWAALPPALGIQTPRPCARYRLSGFLGRGGFASVHRAVDTVLQREVAIKMVAVPEDLAKLSHSNIVHVFDVWARRTLDGEGEELYIVLSTEKVKSCTS